MTVTKLLVAVNDGSFDVESEIRRGTTFTFYLPVYKGKLNKYNVWAKEY